MRSVVEERQIDMLISIRNWLFWIPMLKSASRQKRINENKKRLFHLLVIAFLMSITITGKYGQENLAKESIFYLPGWRLWKNSNMDPWHFEI